jgi:8-oxo-dGTP diphosphatase
LKILLVVAVALIDADDRILIAQRPEGKALAGLWEFPGGKIDAGERPEEALIRELREELGITVKEACLAPLTFASYAYPEFHLLMPLYVCRRWEGFVQSREGQALKWVRARDLRQYPMPPADEPVSEEEQAAIDADNARAEEQAAADEVVEPVVEVVAPPAPKVEAPKVKIVRDYQVEDEQGKPLGRRTHIEGWTNEEIYAKYEAAHTNAVRYAERLKKRIDAMEAAGRTQQSAAAAAHEA